MIFHRTYSEGNNNRYSKLLLKGDITFIKKKTYSTLFRNKLKLSKYHHHIYFQLLVSIFK